MIRTALRSRPKAAILMAVFMAAALAQARAWGADLNVFPEMASVSGFLSESDEDASNLIAMDDFNRDGIADIAQITSPGENHPGPHSLIVELGQANGTFKQTTFNLDLNHDPKSIVAGDFNGDGNPDLIVGDDNGTLMLFLGDGTGKMLPATDIARLDSVVSIVVADFNHDGISDIAISDWRASSVTVFLGAGNGSFRRTWSFPLRMPGTVPHLSVADFNRDHIPDLAVVYGDEDGDTFEVMLGNGNGTFTDAPGLSFVRDPNSHCAT
jgi:hypothetical protein